MIATITINIIDTITINIIATITINSCSTRYCVRVVRVCNQPPQVRLPYDKVPELHHKPAGPDDLDTLALKRLSMAGTSLSLILYMMR